MPPLLEIKNLAVSFPDKNGKVEAVRNLSLKIEEGETHCLVGESGCGKSVSSFAVLLSLKLTESSVAFVLH